MYDNSFLSCYRGLYAQFTPCHPWNKKIKGVERGKTPLHKDWPIRQYKKDEFLAWIDEGLNIGYRISDRELVIDIDPRNFNDDVDTLELLAEYCDCLDFDDLLDTYLTVKTGGGGYHIYCTLNDIDYTTLSEVTDILPGVEFKVKGRQVLAAGSRHPSGKYYKFINPSLSRLPFPKSLQDLILKKINPKKSDYVVGEGALNGPLLQELVLDKLDISNYDTNDTWFPIMCGCHHVTNGEGVEEFVQWSMGDELYDANENDIRHRWQSLDNKHNPITIGTLIKELDNNGEDTKGLKAVLEFSSTADDVEADDDESEEAMLLKNVGDIADAIDVDEIYETPKGQAGVEGAALAAANKLNKTSSTEDKMKCIRLIKAASIDESIEAQEILISKKIMSQTGINKRLKSLDDKITDSFTEVLANKTLEKLFNGGKHLSCEPNGQLWTFHKTHWKLISDEFLGKVVYRVLDTLKAKMDISGLEVNFVTGAVKAIRIRSSVLSPKVHAVDQILPVINCKNGELWTNKDGTHELRKHSYKSYQTSCLKVNYSPSRECPLFTRTINEIFEHYPDRDDIIRHMAEIFGYIIQPYKPMANWWLFKGPGGDGKSTLLKILNGILQDSMLMTNVKLLKSCTEGGNDHATTSLVGKLGVTIEELPAGFVLRDAAVKLLAENTKMEANPKNKGAFNFNYVGSLIMCSNGHPVIRDLSHGMMRRANIIPFNRQFDATGSDDVDRPSNILNDKKEMAGVLNWMLEGYQRLKARGRFLIPDSCEEAKLEWLREANNVIRYSEDCLVKTKPGQPGPLATRVYTHYANWCDLNGVKHRGRNNFYTDLKSVGYNVKSGHKNQLYLYGANLKTEDEDELEGWEDF